MERMTKNDYYEIEEAFEEVFSDAMEASSVIAPKVRDALPDKAFGIVFTDAEGKRQRKYPLVVKNDPEATKQLVAKAIAFFHYCKPDWKQQLANKVMQVIREEKLNVNINSKSQILKYVSPSKIPKTVKIVNTANKK